MFNTSVSTYKINYNNKKNCRVVTGKSQETNKTQIKVKYSANIDKYTTIKLLI